MLAVYTGTSLTNLTLLESNNDIAYSTNLQSIVTFPAEAGTLYNIAVDGFNGATGSVILTLNQTIQNDNFDSCEFIGGLNGSEGKGSRKGVKPLLRSLICLDNLI